MDKEEKTTENSELQSLPEVEKDAENEESNKNETSENEPEKIVVKDAEPEGNPFGDSGRVFMKLQQLCLPWL